MRLILHEGTHKTGTTTIQKVMADNRQWMREHGLFYPDGGTTFGKSSVPHHRFAHALTQSQPKDAQDVADWIHEVSEDACPNDTIIISAEPIYRNVLGVRDWQALSRPDYWERRRLYLEGISDALSAFSVEPILCFRDPNEMQRSLFWTQTDKGEYASNFAVWLREMSPLADYDRQMSLFQQAFGQVTSFSYEEARDKGLVGFFFDVIGFETPPGANDVWLRRTPADFDPAGIRDGE